MQRSYSMPFRVVSTRTTDKSKSAISIGASIQNGHGSSLEYPRSRHNRNRNTTATIESESNLWRAVLCQAVRDVYSPDARVRDETLRWVLSRDFLTVCDFALVEPDSMKEQLANLANLSATLAHRYGVELQQLIAKNEV